MIQVFGCSTGDEELAEVKKCLDSGWLGCGPRVAEFEKAFKSRLVLDDFLLIDSASNGLKMALDLLELPKNSEVILPSFTWVSCAHAVVLAGHKPIFCDVDLHTQNLDAETVASKITSKTGAVMVVHYSGLPINVAGLGLPGKIKIVEDAAHAVDSRIDQVACGDLGHIGVYSFDGMKNLAMGEGGGITSRHKDVMARARLLRYCGIQKSGIQTARSSKSRWWEHQVDEVYSKHLPDDIRASIGLAQLDKLDHNQRVRKDIWDVYQVEFRNILSIERPADAREPFRHSYFTYFIRVLNGRRDELAAYLLENGIYTTMRFHPLHFNSLYGCQTTLPNTEILNAQGLNLPLHPRMTLDDVGLVVDKVKAFFK